MRIGEMAAQTGLTTDAIRYYENEGLLTPPRQAGNGYRDYGPEAVGDLKFIKKAQLVGLRLSDIREVLTIVSGGRRPCDHVRSVLNERLADVERKLGELAALKTTLQTTLTRLDGTPDQSACRGPAIEVV